VFVSVLVPVGAVLFGVLLLGSLGFFA